MNMLNTAEECRRFYKQVSPQYDPDGFRLYFAAQKVTGIRWLWEAFPYEDACGCFEDADGGQLLKYLTAAYFEAISWENVPYVLKCINDVMH